MCYVGDGINDSIALKKAYVSVSMRGASTIATSTAQVVMMNANLSQLCYLFDLAHDFDQHMQTSFLLSLAPGVLTIGGALLLGLGITSSVRHKWVPLRLVAAISSRRAASAKAPVCEPLVL